MTYLRLTKLIHVGIDAKVVNNGISNLILICHCVLLIFG